MALRDRVRNGIVGAACVRMFRDQAKVLPVLKQASEASGLAQRCGCALTDVHIPEPNGALAPGYYTGSRWEFWRLYAALPAPTCSGSGVHTCIRVLAGFFRQPSLVTPSRVILSSPQFDHQLFRWGSTFSCCCPPVCASCFASPDLPRRAASPPPAALTALAPSSRQQLLSVA